MEQRVVKTAAGCIVTVKVTPRASRTECTGADPAWFRIRLQAPPVDNKANEALAEFLAERFSIPKRAVALLSGSTSRIKRLSLAAVTPEQAEAVLGIR